MADSRAMLLPPCSLRSLILWRILSGPAILALGDLCLQIRGIGEDLKPARQEKLGMCPSFASNVPPNQTVTTLKTKIPSSPPPLLPKDQQLTDTGCRKLASSPQGRVASATRLVLFHGFRLKPHSCLFFPPVISCSPWDLFPENDPPKSHSNKNPHLRLGAEPKPRHIPELILSDSS